MQNMQILQYKRGISRQQVAVDGGFPWLIMTTKQLIRDTSRITAEFSHRDGSQASLSQGYVECTTRKVRFFKANGIRVIALFYICTCKPEIFQKLWYCCLCLCFYIYALLLLLFFVLLPCRSYLTPGSVSCTVIRCYSCNFSFKVIFQLFVPLIKTKQEE